MTVETGDGLSILLVEDNPGDARLFEHHLQNSPNGSFPPATVSNVESLEEAAKRLETDNYDVVLLDLGLPQSSGLSTLDRYNTLLEDAEAVDPTPVIVLTGLKDDDVAVKAIERGAQDYLVKDTIDENVLNRTIRYALERHAQQQELRRQNERLERFASVVSHDLRNPLSVAKGRIEMVEDEHAEVVLRNLNRMEAIIDDVLTVAREGRSVEETEPVDLTTLITNCWENVETAVATLSTPDKLTIMTDRSRCRQLLENLIRNSVEHAGESVEITLGALDGGFYFEDDGPGIPEEEYEDIFEAGYTTNRDGTGFGLNIVQEIAEAHGWSVAVTEGTDGGARFEFTGVSFSDSVE